MCVIQELPIFLGLRNAKLIKFNERDFYLIKNKIVKNSLTFQLNIYLRIVGSYGCKIFFYFVIKIVVT